MGENTKLWEKKGEDQIMVRKERAPNYGKEREHHNFSPSYGKEGEKRHHGKEGEKRHQFMGQERNKKPRGHIAHLSHIG
jgi:hypothetical protein